MKNILTIVLASFILISGMHLSIARHICGGELAEVKISFTDAVAACGMESDANTCAAHEKATSDCCKNEITRLSVDDYFGASSLQLKEVTQPVMVLFFLPIIQSLYSVEPEIQAFADVGTQANFIVHDVSLPKICVFRI
jgi:hypothetical protein